MNLAHLRHWVFDLDGTLAYSNLDFPAIKAELELDPHQGILEQLARFPAGRAQAVNRRLAEIEWHHADRATPAPGAHQLLSRLRDNGARLGILTRNRKDIARRTLEVTGLGDFFEDGCILGRDEARPKPDPDGILQLFAAWQTSPNQGVMAGDFRYDIEAGRAAGCLTILVDQQRRLNGEALADLRVDNLAELLPRLERATV